MKKKIIALITAVSAIFGAFTVYAAAPAQKLADMGILQGYEDGELHLERTLTRAEFAKMFCDAFLKDTDITEKTPEFSDVPEGFWGKAYIEKAAAADIISGFEDGTFRPDERVTYEQAATMLVKYMYPFGSYSYSERIYPESYVGEAVDMGISEKVTALIGDEITREAAVYMIDNTMQVKEDNTSADTEQAIMTGMNTFYAPTSAAPGGGGVISSGASIKGMADMAVATEAAYDYDYGYNGYMNTEEYTSEDENIFKNASLSPLSTFSIDADTASYSNLRRFALGSGTFPPGGSIRSEELINYFTYDNPRPTDDTPFEVSTETAKCPWNEENMLVKIAVQGAELTEKQPTNLVFLLDVSGSMYTVEKLPLVKKSLRLLLDELDESDTISLVTYASGTQVVLESTPVSEKDKILEALAGLRAGGGTYGEAGINLAYEQAEKHLIKNGNNRIILCTDGDFNIGNSSTGDLKKLITEKREKGIFLTVLGFGMGNYKDNRLETLADNGNGNYAYIDNEREAKKVFVDEMPKTLYTIAKDVKIQVEFNAAAVKEYRLIGYENRILNNEDFENDKKDAGELGCGATVTALYELVRADNTQGADNAGESGLKYQTSEITGDEGELMTVKVRYKEPDGNESKLIEKSVPNNMSDEMSEDFKFVSAVAELGMLLNDSEYKGSSTYDSVINLAKDGIGSDSLGFRTEFLHIADILRYANTYRDYSEANDFYTWW